MRIAFNIKNMNNEFVDFNYFLHEVRSRCIRRLNCKADSVLHIAAAGKWYFEWFSENYKYDVRRQVGIDINEKPNDLDDSITWYSKDASDLSIFESESFDMIFAGQFIEHIGPINQAKFLIEVNRVLKKDGILVIDSPNYAITNKYGWKQPEHISEFSYKQAKILINISGFDILEETGLIPEKLFPHVFPNSKYIQPIDTNSIVFDIEQSLSSNPEDCFIWWFVCKKTNDNFKGDLVYSLSDEFYNYNKKQEKVVYYSQVGKIISDLDFIETGIADTGFIIFGPYIELKPGDYSATFNLTHPPTSDLGNCVDGSLIVCKLDIVADAGETCLCKKDISFADITQNSTFVLKFKVQNSMVIETRVFTTGLIGLKCSLNIDITSTGSNDSV